MLVLSPRLRPGDLEVWDRHEAEDIQRVHLERGRLERMAQRARREIRAFLGRGPAYMSCSWGKDSIVVLDLVMSVAPTVPVVWLRSEWTANPDCLLVRDAAMQRWPLRYEEVIPTEDDGDWDHTFDRAARAVQRRYGGRLSGVRADESATRRMSALVHGISTAASCRPILGWSTDDVWSWIALRDLPAHPAYAMTLGGAIPRDTIRTATLWDDTTEEDVPGTAFGRAEWERTYYGDVIAVAQKNRIAEQ